MTMAQTSRKDSILRKVAALTVWATYRKVEVFRADTTTSDPGPLMSTSNHFGGFLDPLLMMYAMPRRPRFIARDVIWKIPLVKSFMNWLGAIPVHKAEDRDKGSNDKMFASCYDALEEGGHLLIFPEGITRDQPSIGKVKTGTARIVMGARNSGAEGISIVPAGIHYEDKASLRSRASIMIGAPIKLDESIAQFVKPGQDPGPDNREAVRALTDEIDLRLRNVAPDFDDWKEATSLTRAAEITLSQIGGPDHVVSIAQRDILAGMLADSSEEARTAIHTSLMDYEHELQALALTDEDFSKSTDRSLLWELTKRLVIGLLLLPYAILGLIIHIIPFLIVKGVGLLRLAPSAMASLKPIAAILAFGLTWGVIAWRVLSTFGWISAAAALLVVPLYGVAAVVLWERVQFGARTFRARRRRGVTGSVEDRLLHGRRQVVSEVLSAL